MGFLRAARVVASLVLVAACGSSFSSVSGGDGGGSDGGGDATTNDGASDAPGDVPSGDDGPASCPDVSGHYTLSAVGATGCGDLSLAGTECIKQTVCDIAFQSTIATGAGGIDGDATLESDGSFANAALKEGSANRSGCSGTWTAGTSTMTVDCGSTGTPQSCVVALQRTASKCP